MHENILSIYHHSNVYCGVNHDIKLYNGDHCPANRNGQYFLNDENEKPTMIFQQANPLSVHPSVISNPLYGITTFSIEDKNIDFLNNYVNYDIIIVSRIYAEYAKRCFKSYADYLDRLRVPVPVYNKDPETHDDSKKVGVVFLQRVVPVNEPHYYIQLLNDGFYPSILSINDTINNSRLPGKHLTILNRTAVMDLERQLYNYNMNGILDIKY